MTTKNLHLLLTILFYVECFMLGFFLNNLFGYGLGNWEFWAIIIPNAIVGAMGLRLYDKYHNNEI